MKRPPCLGASVYVMQGVPLSNTQNYGHLANDRIFFYKKFLFLANNDLLPGSFLSR
jgi:hypothetical protein